MPAPCNLRAHRERLLLEVVWDDGTSIELPFRLLRESCPCAACVDENTGRRILDITTIPDDIAPLKLSLAGNYALRIAWSDRHETGLYTWEHLAQLAAQTADSPESTER